jgi:hypothetical protein
MPGEEEQLTFENGIFCNTSEGVDASGKESNWRPPITARIPLRERRIGIDG